MRRRFGFTNGLLPRTRRTTRARTRSANARRAWALSPRPATISHAPWRCAGRIDYQRDLAMARLALDDRAGYKKACARMLELAEATQDRAAAQMTALTCVLDANTVSKWDAVIRLAARAAEGYDGDYRIHVAALFRAGRFDEALRRPWSKDRHYAEIPWEWFFQGMLRHQAGRHEEARPILEQKIKLVDLMYRDMPRDPKSKIWSDWIYHIQCQILRDEADALLCAASD